MAAPSLIAVPAANANVVTANTDPTLQMSDPDLYSPQMTQMAGPMVDGGQVSHMAGPIVDGGEPTADPNFMKQAILKQFQTLSTPTTANDASILAQTGAYNLQADRGLKDTQNQLAEQAYAQGNLGAGGTQTAYQRSREDASAAKAGFVGKLMGDAEKDRKASLMTALGMGAQYEQADKSLAQNQGQFDKSQAQNQGQFDKQIAETTRQFNENKDQHAAEFAKTMGFNYDQLNQQDKEFVANLALQKELAIMQNETSRAGIGASAGAAGAALQFQKDRALTDDQRWNAYNPQDVIDATNQSAIRKAMGLD